MTQQYARRLLGLLGFVESTGGTWMTKALIMGQDPSLLASYVPGGIRLSSWYQGETHSPSEDVFTMVDFTKRVAQLGDQLLAKEEAEGG
jgi:hypothetical protein